MRTSRCSWWPKEKVGKELSKGQSLTATVVIDRPLVLPVEAGEVGRPGRAEPLMGRPRGRWIWSPLARCSRPTLGTKIARFFCRIVLRVGRLCMRRAAE